VSRFDARGGRRFAVLEDCPTLAVHTYARDQLDEMRFARVVRARTESETDGPSGCDVAGAPPSLPIANRTQSVAAYDVPRSAATRARARRRLLVAGAAAAFALALAAAPVLAASIVKRSAGPLFATLTASTHAPKIGVAMTIKVTATLNGKPAHAALTYQYLFGDVVVSTRYPCNGKACSFTGRYSDRLTFPATSLGTPLTLQVVVKAAGHTVKLGWSVTSNK